MSETNGAELFEKLESHAIRVKSIRDQCAKEEQTKASLISPYLELLGFEVSDPRHVLFEYRADISTGTERVDYALLRDGKPYIFVEAKSATQKLPKKPSKQILRYAMAVDSVHYAAMTNGVDWYWYCKKPGSAKLDESLFFSHNTTSPQKSELEFLRLLPPHVSSERLAGVASQERYRLKIVDWISRQRNAPDDRLIRLLVQVIGESRTKSVQSILSEIWPKIFSDYIQNEVDKVLALARVPDDQETRAVGMVSLGPSYPETLPRSGSIDTDSEATSNGVHGQREFRTIKGTVLLKASKQRKAWRPKNEAYWRVAPSFYHVVREILKYLSVQHDAGPQAFYEGLANSSNRAFRRKSDGPLPEKQFAEVVPGYWLRRSSTKENLRVLKKLAGYCIKGNQPVEFESQFDLWPPVATQDRQSEAAD